MGRADQLIEGAMVEISLAFDVRTLDPFVAH
jgi:hypothetical protein